MAPSTNGFSFLLNFLCFILLFFELGEKGLEEIESYFPLIYFSNQNAKCSKRHPVPDSKVNSSISPQSANLHVSQSLKCIIIWFFNHSQCCFKKSHEVCHVVAATPVRSTWDWKKRTAFCRNELSICIEEWTAKVTFRPSAWRYLFYLCLSDAMPRLHCEFHFEVYRFVIHLNPNQIIVHFYVKSERGLVSASGSLRLIQRAFEEYYNDLYTRSISGNEVSWNCKVEVRGRRNSVIDLRINSFYFNKEIWGINCKRRSSANGNWDYFVSHCFDSFNDRQASLTILCKRYCFGQDFRRLREFSLSAARSHECLDDAYYFERSGISDCIVLTWEILELYECLWGSQWKQIGLYSVYFIRHSSSETL